MKNEPLFSIVIPAYNRASVISRTIDSCFSQTFNDFEIIIVDDGSTDNQKIICDQYNSDKINYIYQNNTGSNPARNAGIKHSKGKYISFLDSDDAWKPEYLEEVKRKFESDDEIGFVWVKNIKIFLPNGRKQIKKSRNLEGYIYKDVLKKGFLINSSCITAKRSLLDSIGGWDNNLKACQDDDLCFRLTKNTKTGCIDKALSIFYIDEQIDRISSSSSRRAFSSLQLWEKYADDILSLFGKCNLEKKIINVYFLFAKNNNKEGYEKCRLFLQKYLNYSKFNYHVFILKCSTKIAIFKLKNIIKKIIRR